MNTNIALPSDRPWQVGAYDPDAASRLGPGQRSYSATHMLDFATVVRIIAHWRWLVLGAVALGLAAAMLVTLLTTPIYRAWVTLEANPPTVSVSDEQSREREATNTNPYDFVATQVGLVSSKSVAQRTAQELNLANNPDVVSQSLDASKRLRAATAAVRPGSFPMKSAWTMQPRRSRRGPWSMCGARMAAPSAPAISIPGA